MQMLFRAILPNNSLFTPPPHCVDRAFALTRQLGLHPCDLHMWVRQLIISAFQSHVRYLVRSVTGYVLNMIHKYCSECIYEGIKRIPLDAEEPGESDHCVMCFCGRVARRQPDNFSECMLRKYHIYACCDGLLFNMSLATSNGPVRLTCSTMYAKMDNWGGYRRNGPVTSITNSDCVEAETVVSVCNPGAGWFCTVCNRNPYIDDSSSSGSDFDDRHSGFEFTDHSDASYESDNP